MGAHSGPRSDERDWAIRTTAQRHGRNGAVIAALTGILSIGVSVCALQAAGGLGLPGWGRVLVLVFGVVATAGLGAAAIVTESMARH